VGEADLPADLLKFQTVYRNNCLHLPVNLCVENMSIPVYVSKERDLPHGVIFLMMKRILTSPVHLVSVTLSPSLRWHGLSSSDGEARFCPKYWLHVTQSL
jgi:hypothetical protein